MVRSTRREPVLDAAGDGTSAAAKTSTGVAGAVETLSPEELQRTAQVLTAEYGLLMGAVGAAWSASLVRTSIYLGVLSAAGVALGFAAQASPDGRAFETLALVVLPLVLFLGVATFIRLVQVQREAIIYITGLNRIRHFFQEVAPASRPFHVLPAFDDERALYRSLGTGMARRAPRQRFFYLIVQTQGIVGVVTGVVAGALGGLVAAQLGTIAGSSLAAEIPWLAAAIAFGLTLVLLLSYWQRSLAELRAGIRPLYPTPPEEYDAPF